MDDLEEKYLKKLEEEAGRWVEAELAVRMAHAKEAIEEQVDISMPEVGPARAGAHLKKALAFAEENIRMDLELEAQAWIDEEIKKRGA
jgi:hypothetical protein